MSYTEQERRNRVAEAILRRCTHCAGEWVHEPRLLILAKLTHMMSRHPEWMKGTKFDLDLPEGRKLVMGVLYDAFAHLKPSDFIKRSISLDRFRPHSKGMFVEGYIKGRRK